MRRHALAISFFVGCLCILNQPYICLGKSESNLPDFMNKLVFQKKEFVQPIQFCFPKQDSRDVLTEIRTTRFGIEKVFYNSGYSEIDKHVLSYLVKHEFCQVESARVQAQYGPGNIYYFLFYTDKFNLLSNLSSSRSHVCLDVAKRVVKSIDYQNRYKGSPRGIEMQFYAITFSYILDGSLPELPKIGKTYEGKAKACQDPDDGKWKLVNFQLEDRGKEEFMSQIRAKYAPYDPKLVAKEFPAQKGVINDFANVISNNYKQQIEKVAKELLTRAKVPIVIVTMPDMGGAEINNYAACLYDTWDIGNKVGGKGVLLFITTKERKMRIQYEGLENILSDQVCGQIIDKDMVPCFQQGNFGLGLLRGATAIGEIITN